MMHSGLFYLISLVLAVSVLLLYMWPVPKHPFGKLFSRVDEKKTSSLRDFRANSPLKKFQTGRTVWEYLTLGQSREAILFLHGTTGAYDIWWQQMEALKDKFLVISLTYPPVSGLEKLGRGVLKILDLEGVEKANIVGSSLGGYLAQYLMSTHPERVKRAVFANTFPPNDIIAEKNRSLGAILPYLPAWFVMQKLRKSFYEKIYPASGHDELTLAYMLEQSYGRMGKAHLKSRFSCVVDAFVPVEPTALGIPVAIIEADNDPLVEKTLRERLKAVYPSATVYTLHNTGHFPYLNMPEQYTGILAGFFAEA